MIALSGFDWDDGNREKCQRHGVSIGEIEALFLGLPRIAQDPRHSNLEDRFIAVGRNEVGKPLFVAFTFRAFEGMLRIRPVSARYMHQKEALRYGQARSSSEN